MGLERPRRLYLSKIDDRFDKNRDILFSPFCVEEREEIFPDWEAYNFIDPSDDPETIYKWYLSAGKLSSALVWELASELNTLHCTNYSLKFWRELLIPWICLAIQLVIGKYLGLSRILERYGEEKVVVDIVKDSVDWDIADILDFSQRLRDPAMEHWIGSVMLAKLAPETWHLNEVEISYSQPRTTSEKAPLARTRLSHFVRKFYGRLRFDNVAGVRLLALPFSIYLSLLPSRKDNTPDHAHAPSVSAIKVPDEIVETVRLLVKNARPQSYVSSFHDRCRFAGSAKFRRGRLVVTSVTRYNDDERFITAFAKEAGERIVRTAHGINPGTSKFLIANEYEYDNHAYLSWGWSEHEQYRERFVKAPSPLLSKYTDKHRLKSDKLIFIGTAMRSQTDLFRPIPQPRGFIRYRTDKFRFFDALDRRVRECVSYRPYERGQSNDSERRAMMAKYPDIKFLDHDFHQQLMCCRLSVHDHPGTSLLITMAANVPTIIYWEKDLWPLAPTAAPYFYELERANILFRNPLTAAAKVDAIWNDTVEWWSSDRVQGARQKWCSQFALTSKFWWFDWLKILYRL